MRAQKTKWGLALLVAALCVSSSWAQEKDPRATAPVAPLPPLGVESTSKAPAAGAPAPQSDSGRTRTITGIDNGSLGGGIWSGRSFIVPTLNINFRGETDSNGGPTRAEASLAGRLAFQHLWGRNSFTSDYNGSGTFNIHNSNRKDAYHSWMMSYGTSGRRWSLSFNNAFGFSPQGGIGGGLGNAQLNSGAGGFGNSSLVNLNPFLQQNQTVFALGSSRITDTLAGQASYQLTAKSALTFSGNYGILRFLEGGLTDSNNYGFRTGYNRALNGRDTLAFSYGMSAFQFSGAGNNNVSHVLHVSYGRQISGRLSVRAAAGPNLTQVRIPATGDIWQTSWSMSGAASYRMNFLDASLEYSRGTTGGAGFFLGAVTDDVRATLSRPLTRMWTGSVNVGFARNQDLVSMATGVSGRRFLTWRGGFQVARPVGRQSRVYFQYGVERQSSTNVGCTAGTCAFIGTRQTFGMGFNFSFRSIALD